MALLFSEETFLSLIGETEAYGKDSMIKGIFPEDKGVELKRKERLFEVAIAIMKAKSTSALDKYSTEEIIACMEVHDEVCKVMEKATAGKTFENFLKVLVKSKSAKRRRVL